MGSELKKPKKAFLLEYLFDSFLQPRVQIRLSTGTGKQKPCKGVGQRQCPSATHLCLFETHRGGISRGRHGSLSASCGIGDTWNLYPLHTDGSSLCPDANTDLHPCLPCVESHSVHTRTRQQSLRVTS